MRRKGATESILLCISGRNRDGSLCPDRGQGACLCQCADCGDEDNTRLELEFWKEWTLTIDS